MATPDCNHCNSDTPHQHDHTTSSLITYYPLILILTYLVLGVGVAQLNAGHFDRTHAMHQFMGGFFVVFSFFKMLDVKGFAEAYSTYDLVAKKIPAYGLAYPFIELILGLAYWTEMAPALTNITTVIVMSVSSIGVIQALNRKNNIQCACLGTVFKLPMTQITLIEDLLMVAMALAQLVL